MKWVSIRVGWYYVDIHKASEEDRRQAGQQFRTGAEIARQDMSDPALATPCETALAGIERRLDALRAANAEGEKLAP